MSKKGTRALASATLMSLVLTTALAAGPVKAAQGSVTRIGAADRYATAAQVATQNWKDGAKDVVLVSGEGYADAVSASVLAKQLDAPILLTTAGSLNADAKAALETLKPTNVYVVGGNASVSASIRSDLKANYTLVELGGANRYETNVAVAKKLVDLGVKADNVLLVGGEGFSDALSVAPVAATKGQILLLGNNNADSMKSVIDFVKANSSKVTVVGTSNVISEAIYNAVGAVDRVNGGASRFDTNINVLNKFADDLKADKLFVANASGNGYADALVASALAGKSAAPLVLVDAEGTSATTAALNYIKAKATKTTDLNVVGGTGVVSQATVDAINAIFGNGPTTPGNTTVKSIESVDLNQIRVTFGTDVDEDSAESIGNYKIDGTTLTANDAVANLADDNRTVLITLKTAKEQQKTYTVSVKNGVLSSDKSSSIDAFDQEVQFSDVTAPTISSVAVKGNSKITVNFTEPVKVSVGSYTTGQAIRPDSNFASKFKINGQNISSFGLDTSKSEVKHAIATTTGSYVWADRVDFYFSSKLPTGSNTLKVSDGDVSGVLVDAAGFIVKEITEDFTVDSQTTAPTVKEVKADADGTLWVRFDRPMDSYTAAKGNYYGLNGDGNAISRDGELKEGDCTVKFKGLDFNTGSNTLYIKDSIKDAFGNKVEDDTRVSFTTEKDETKPTVTNVTMVDSETIRVTFSKDVQASYAVNTDNYTLKDSSNVDISDHIKVVKPASLSVSDDTTASNIVSRYNPGNDNVWDIKMYKTNPANTNDDWRLTGSKYTLEVKNLADTTSNHNVMDDYTATVSGTDDVAPKMNGVAYRKDNHKIVVLFSEAMDGDKLSNIDSYKYKNGSGDSKQLPSDTKITVGNDDKSVTLEFPSSYYIYNGNATPTTLDSDNVVRGILASDLKDVAGNVLDSFNNSSAIAVDGSGNVITNSSFGYKTNTYRIENDGDDLVAKVQFTNAIDPDTAKPEYFTVAGQTPDSVSINGSDVVLRFNKDDNTSSSPTIGSIYTKNISDKISDKADKLDVIKLVGAAAELKVKGVDAQGNGLKDIAGASASTDGSWVSMVSLARNYTAAPKTTSDYWYATTNTGAATTTAAVVLTFDTKLDSQNSGVKADDFRFTINGSEVKANTVKVVNNTLVFLFTGADQAKFETQYNASSTPIINVSLKNTSIDVEAIDDGNGDNAKYVPSSDDTTKTRQVKIKPAQTDLDSILN